MGFWNYEVIVKADFPDLTWCTRPDVARGRGGEGRRVTRGGIFWTGRTFCALVLSFHFYFVHSRHSVIYYNCFWWLDNTETKIISRRVSYPLQSPPPKKKKKLSHITTSTPSFGNAQTASFSWKYMETVSNSPHDQALGPRQQHDQIRCVMETSASRSEIPE